MFGIKPWFILSLAATVWSQQLEVQYHGSSNIRNQGLNLPPIYGPKQPSEPGSPQTLQPVFIPKHPTQNQTNPIQEPKSPELTQQESKQSPISQTNSHTQPILELQIATKPGTTLPKTNTQQPPALYSMRSEPMQIQSVNSPIPQSQPITEPRPTKVPGTALPKNDSEQLPASNPNPEEPISHIQPSENTSKPTQPSQSVPVQPELIAQPEGPAHLSNQEPDFIPRPSYNPHLPDKTNSSKQDTEPVFVVHSEPYLPPQYNLFLEPAPLPMQQLQSTSKPEIALMSVIPASSNETSAAKQVQPSYPVPQPNPVSEIILQQKLYPESQSFLEPALLSNARPSPQSTLTPTPDVASSPLLPEYGHGWIPSYLQIPNYGSNPYGQASMPYQFPQIPSIPQSNASIFLQHPQLFSQQYPQFIPEGALNFMWIPQLQSIPRLNIHRPTYNFSNNYEPYRPQESHTLYQMPQYIHEPIPHYQSIAQPQLNLPAQPIPHLSPILQPQQFQQHQPNSQPQPETPRFIDLPKKEQAFIPIRSSSSMLELNQQTKQEPQNIILSQQPSKQEKDVLPYQSNNEHEWSEIFIPRPSPYPLEESSKPIPAPQPETTPMMHHQQYPQSIPIQDHPNTYSPTTSQSVQVSPYLPKHKSERLAPYVPRPSNESFSLEESNTHNQVPKTGPNLQLMPHLQTTAKPIAQSQSTQQPLPTPEPQLNSKSGISQLTPEPQHPSIISQEALRPYPSEPYTPAAYPNSELTDRTSEINQALQSGSNLPITPHPQTTPQPIAQHQSTQQPQATPESQLNSKPGITHQRPEPQHPDITQEAHHPYPSEPHTLAGYPIPELTGSTSLNNQVPHSGPNLQLKPHPQTTPQPIAQRQPTEESQPTPEPQLNPKPGMLQQTHEPQQSGTISQEALRPYPSEANTTAVNSNSELTDSTSVTSAPVKATTFKPMNSTYKPVKVALEQNFDCKKGDGYYADQKSCAAYIECKHNLAVKHYCPDGLYFNPAAKWNEYLCGYPSDVKCSIISVKPKPNPAEACPEYYGFFAMKNGDCSKYIRCQEGKPMIMDCPSGLAFNVNTSSCDWPENVPLCNPNAFKDFKCPEPPLNEEGQPSDFIYKYRYGDQCKQYVACQRGFPRLLSCDSGQLFDQHLHSCRDEKLVQDCAWDLDP